MSLKFRIALCLLTAMSLAPAAAMADDAMPAVSVSPFYQDVMKMRPEGKVGQIIKKEQVATPIAGAQAWRIAYISSDLNDVPTISTGLVVAPVGEAPAGGRPIISWSHGTPVMRRTAAPRRSRIRRSRLTSISS